MKLIIAGSRTIDKYRGFYEAIDQFCIGFDSEEGVFDCRHFDIHEFVTGECELGADQIPRMLMKLTYIEDYEFPITSFKPDWGTHGRAAGPIRNREMAKYGDALLLIWDGASRGSANMKQEMIKLGKPVYEVILKQHNAVTDTEEL